MRAKDETGDSNAPIQNKKAYYEIVEAIIKSAMSKVSRKNPKVAELEMKRLKLMEEFYGANSEIVISEWKMVSVGDAFTLIKKYIYVICSVRTGM